LLVKKPAITQKAPAAHQKPVEKFSDKELLELLGNHLIEVFSRIKNAPTLIYAGKVIKKDYDASKKQVTMYL
jgi:hypothetical protein